ncbi:MAG: hypothetical protein H7Z43_14690 [Clostridia bacterium]|nr:hypothetical protein [Deltaproteobacteria bacterium]
MRVVTVAFALAMAACGEPFLDYPTKVAYGPFSQGVLVMTGPLSTDRIPTTLEEGARNDSAVFVIDLATDSLTYGQLAQATFTYDASALQISAVPVPIFCARAPRRLAFCVLDSVRDVNGKRLGRAKDFNDAFNLDGDDPSDGAFVPLRPALIEAGYELGSISGATYFDDVRCTN